MTSYGHHFPERATNLEDALSAFDFYKGQISTIKYSLTDFRIHSRSIYISMIKITTRGFEDFRNDLPNSDLCFEFESTKFKHFIKAFGIDLYQEYHNEFFPAESNSNSKSKSDFSSTNETNQRLSVTYQSQMGCKHKMLCYVKNKKQYECTQCRSSIDDPWKCSR